MPALFFARATWGMIGAAGDKRPGRIVVNSTRGAWSHDRRSGRQATRPDRRELHARRVVD